MVQERREPHPPLSGCRFAYTFKRTMRILPGFVVRSAFCLPVFPLIGPLPSTSSAAAIPSALFGGFAGTTGPSHFHHVRPRVGPLAFPKRPAAPSAKTPEHRTSRFSREKFPRMYRVSDRAGSQSILR